MPIPNPRKPKKTGLTKYLFDTLREEVISCGSSKPYGAKRQQKTGKIGKGIVYRFPRYKYLFHWHRKSFYEKGDGLWFIKNEQIIKEKKFPDGHYRQFFRRDYFQLMTEYQFQLLLRHTPVRNKILQEGDIVTKVDAIEMYRDISAEGIVQLQSLGRNKSSDIVGSVEC